MRKELITFKPTKIVGVERRIIQDGSHPSMYEQIDKFVHNYLETSIASQIPERKKPGTTYCVYTDYAKDHAGDFTYFIGEESDVEDNELTGDLASVEIPAQKYMRFTNGPAAMPHVLLNVWQAVWSMDSKELGGERSYLCNFEVYDERAKDPNNVELDVYIGLR